MTAYYNEIEPFAAQWLRNLIAANLIAPGEVDERSIADVSADDLRGFTQCHFFAGIGIWSHALRLAGWPDEREVWTGSCPCQPFSAAGKGEGYADERNLWPHWYRLIGECRPSVVFGEQVDAAIRTGWLDDVCLSLEELDYAVGAVSFPACSVGAPHIRQRLYFVADSEHSERRPISGPEQDERNGDDAGRAQAHGIAGTCCAVRELADADGRNAGAERLQRSGEHGFKPQDGGAGRLEHPEGDGRIERRAEPSGRGTAGGCSAGDMGDAEQQGLEGLARHGDDRDQPGRQRENETRPVAEAGPTNGFWHDAEWLPCRDGKARPAKPGIFPLAARYPGRVGILRAAGNAIVPQQAAVFIAAAMECMP